MTNEINQNAADLLQTTREALGLSVNQMAQSLGLTGIAAGDNVRQMERCKRPISGPVQVLVRYMAAAARVQMASAPEELALAEATRQRLQPSHH